MKKYVNPWHALFLFWALALIFAGRLFGDDQWPQQFAFCLGAGVFLAVFISSLGQAILHRQHFLFAWAAFAVTSGVVTMALTPFTKIDPMNVAASTQGLAGLGVFKILVTFLFGAFAYSFLDTKKINKIILIVGLLNSIFLLGDQYLWSSKQISLLGNRSIGACFAALFVILAIKHRTFGYAAIGIVSVCLTHSMIALAALSVGLIGMVTRSIPIGLFVRKFTFPLLLLVPVGLVLAINNWHGDSQRFEFWNYFTKYYWDHAPIMGKGLGSFKFWSPTITNGMESAHNTVWLWMHNDWLETLFELGPLGLLLMVLAYLQTLWDSRYQPENFGFVLALGVIMTFNYPMQLSIFVVTATFVFLEIYERPIR